LLLFVALGGSVIARDKVLSVSAHNVGGAVEIVRGAVTEEQESGV